MRPSPLTPAALAALCIVLNACGETGGVIPPEGQPSTSEVGTPDPATLRSLTPVSTPPSTPVPAPPTEPVEAEPELDFNLGGLGDGPFLLYCHSTGRAALLNEAGNAGTGGRSWCLSPEMVSGKDGFAVSQDSVLQFPAFHNVGDCFEVVGGWSANGRYLPTINYFNEFVGNQLFIFDVWTGECRHVHNTELWLDEVVLSPTGEWVVMVETDESPLYRPPGVPPSQLIALSSDKRTRWELYDIYDREIVSNAILGWLSESELIVSRVSGDCPVELVHIDLSIGTAQSIYGASGQPALDPESGTILLTSPGRCESDDRQELIRLGADSGWQPALVPTPEGWGPEWSPGPLVWMPELDRFVTWVDTAGDPQALLATIDRMGAFDLELKFSGEGFNGFFPSPDGSLLLVGGAEPHGSVLYDSKGNVFSELTDDIGALNSGLRAALWFPSGETVYLIPVGVDAIYQADEAGGWQPEMVVPSIEPGSELGLVNQPAYPFWEPCVGRTTRLAIGLRVEVNEQDPRPSRLRRAPSTTAGVLALLPPGPRAEILDGPVCDERFIWWYLVPEGQEPAGWVADTIYGVRVLLPVDP